MRGIEIRQLQLRRDPHRNLIGQSLLQPDRGLPQQIIALNPIGLEQAIVTGTQPGDGDGSIRPSYKSRSALQIRRPAGAAVYTILLQLCGQIRSCVISKRKGGTLQILRRMLPIGIVNRHGQHGIRHGCGGRCGQDSRQQEADPQSGKQPVDLGHLITPGSASAVPR